MARQAYCQHQALLAPVLLSLQYSETIGTGSLPSDMEKKIILINNRCTTEKPEGIGHTSLCLPII